MIKAIIMKGIGTRLSDTFFKGSLLLFIVLSSCKNDDLDNRLPDCSAEDKASLNEIDRQVVATITNVHGTVDDSLCDIFFLNSDFPEDSPFIGAFFACHLPDSFKKNGLEVLYSGYVYETFELEDRCGQYFLLTEIDIR